MRHPLQRRRVPREGGSTNHSQEEGVGGQLCPFKTQYLLGRFCYKNDGCEVGIILLILTMKMILKGSVVFQQLQYPSTVDHNG